MLDAIKNIDVSKYKGAIRKKVGHWIEMHLKFLKMLYL